LRRRSKSDDSTNNEHRDDHGRSDLDAGVERAKSSERGVHD